MPDYIVQKEVRYAGKTYKAGESIPVATRDVRVLLAIGTIREAPRDDRVKEYTPPPAGPTVADHMVEHNAHMAEENVPEETAFVHEEHNPEETVSGGAVEHEVQETDFAGEPEFQVEDTPMPEETQKRTYRTRRMKSED